jgi:hypothetical protein
LKQATRCCQNLESLEISTHVGWGEELDQIIRELSCLKSFSPDDDRHSYEVLVHPGYLLNLERLNLKNIFIHSGRLSQIITAHPHLKSLRLGSVSDYGDVLSELGDAECLPGLQHLDLGFLRIYDTELYDTELLDRIFRAHPGLRSFKIISVDSDVLSAEELTRVIVDASASYHLDLESLSLPDCSFNEKHFRQIFKAYPHLKSFALRYHVGEAPSVLEDSEILPFLEKLRFDSSTSMQSEQVERICRAHPSLKSLKINYSCNILSFASVSRSIEAANRKMATIRAMRERERQEQLRSTCSSVMKVALPMIFVSVGMLVMASRYFYGNF